MSVSCVRCGAAIADGARFCSACGAPVEAPLGAERKLATIVFADLVGSTGLVQGRDPEEARRLLEPFFEVARATLEEHGGRVEKFIGDAVVAVFGVPRAHGDDPDRAVAAALALVERLAARSDQLEVRVGVEAGEVLAGARGGDLAVTGEPAHAAARLQQAAGAGEILVGARAAAAARTVALTERRTIPAPGFPEPLEAWLASDGAGARAGADEPVSVPLLGRGGELETLRLAYMQAVRERSPRLALIVGEAGAGKTRLTRELIETVRGLEPSPWILTGRNPPYGDGIAFWALGEILRSAAGASANSGAPEVRAALAARLRALEAGDPEETAAALAGTLATGEAEVDTVVLRRAWRRLLAALGDERPVLLAVDDAHWADEGFIELLESAAALPSCPLLVVCTARPEIDERRPGLADGPGGQRVELGPLPEPAAQELAATLVAGSDPELARQIAATSGGNPFFAEEIAHAIAGGGESRERLPDTVQAAIASRLDALPAAEKRAAQRAAVLGDRFRVEELAELLDEDPEPVLTGLRGRALVEDRTAEEAGLYAFHHQLIREVAYASLTRSERVRLHQRAAAGIGERAGGRYAELAEVIAFHVISAAELDPADGRAKAAFEAARKASGYAAKRGAPARAQELLEQAASFAPDPRLEIEALIDAYEIAISRFRGDHAIRLLTQAAEIAERSGDGAQAAHLYARAVEIATRMGGISGTFRRQPRGGPDPEEARLREVLARARGLVPAPDPALEALLTLNEAWIAWRFGREYEMGGPASEALELAREADDVLLLSSALDAASAAPWWEGRFVDAASLSRERVETLTGQPPSALMATERSDALNMLSEALVRAGKPREAWRWDTVNADELAETAPHVSAARGLYALYLLGEWDLAAERGARVRESWYAEGRPPFVPLAPSLACVAAIHGFRGDEASERDWIRFAELVAQDSREQLPGVRLFEADLALHRGEVERAVGLLEPLQSFWWSHAVVPKRAEALVLSRGRDSEEAVALAGAREVRDGPIGTAVRLRARGLLEGDERLLHDALASFERMECAPEAARTGWLLGGEDRRRAEATFERLGALAPVEP